MAQFTTSLDSPPTPALNTTPAIGDTPIRVTWSDTLDNGDYRVQLRQEDTSWFLDERVVDHDTTQIDFVGLTPNTTYEVRLRQETTDTTGDWSDTVSILVLPPIRSLEATRDGVWVDITWEENLDTEDGFYLYRSFNNDTEYPTNFELVADISANKTSYRDPLWGGQSATYALTAYDGSTETREIQTFFDPCADEEITRELARGLPDYYPNAESTGNYKLLEAVGRELMCLNLDIDVVDAVSTVQTARSVDELEALGAIIDSPPKEDEGMEKYRARLQIEYAVLTSEGTIADLLNTVAEVLDTDPTQLGYSEPPDTDSGTVRLSVPGDLLEDHPMSDSELVDAFEELIAGSYSITMTRTGTFTYITPSEYDSDNHDASAGYDGLDAQGDPTDDGGTYAGVI